MNKKAVESTLMNAIIVLSIMAVVALIIIVIAYGIKTKVLG